jgi:glycosyltransferase involved in cell wall biosynthesis
VRQDGAPGEALVDLPRALWHKETVQGVAASANGRSESGHGSPRAGPRNVETRRAVRPRLLYLVTEDWYFWSHRLPMARAARDAGFEVCVATRVRDHRERILGEGLTLYPLQWRRGGVGARTALRAVHEISEIARLYRRVRPDVVHHVALKPVVYGSIAGALAHQPPAVNALTGLGFAFSSPGHHARFIQRGLRLALSLVLRQEHGFVVVQNADDARILLETGLVAHEKVRIIRGSGVDTSYFSEQSEPPGPFTIGYVGRMLEDKGVRTLLEAHAKLRERGLDVTMVLAGSTDTDNPTAIPSHELEALAKLPHVRWLGHVDDVRDVWRECHVAVLPSRREGLPLSLLEAAACGRPLVATDVPGCREIAIAGKNALVVPPDDAAALANAIARLAENPALRRTLGAASRPLVMADLTVEAVGARMLSLYEELISRRAEGEG